MQHGIQAVCGFPRWRALCSKGDRHSPVQFLRYPLIHSQILALLLICCRWSRLTHESSLYIALSRHVVAPTSGCRLQHGRNLMKKSRFFYVTIHTRVILFMIAVFVLAPLAFANAQSQSKGLIYSNSNVRLIACRYKGWQPYYDECIRRCTKNPECEGRCRIVYKC
jgi:hypothetical protein